MTKWRRPEDDTRAQIAVLQEMDALRRLAGGYTRLRGEPGGHLLDATNRPIGKFVDPRDAVYFARLHNTFNGLVNLILDLRRRLTDREAMTKEMQ